MLVTIVSLFCIFFFKQKTADDMRISDWSSDVCSSDLPVPDVAHVEQNFSAISEGQAAITLRRLERAPACDWIAIELHTTVDRKSVVKGTSVSVRVDPGGRRIIKKKKIASI